MLRKNSGIEKFQAKEGGSFTVLSKFSKNSQDRKNFAREPFCVSEKIGEQYFMDKRVGGGIRTFRRSFCLTVPKYFIGEHFSVSEKFFFRKFSCIGGGGASRFCQNFSSHMTKTKSIVKEPFCFPEKFWYRKKIMDKRGPITIFSRNFYVSQCRNVS